MGIFWAATCHSDILLFGVLRVQMLHFQLTIWMDISRIVKCPSSVLLTAYLGSFPVLHVSNVESQYEDIMGVRCSHLDSWYLQGH